MLETNFAPWPSYSEEEIEAVQNVLRSNQVNYWTGLKCREFEEAFADYVGVKHAIALSNGTVALDLALIALGVGKGDEVIVTSRTFIASVSSIVNAGATPIFADVDRDSQNITVDSISQVITNKTKAIICVHLAGWPCDMDPIMALAYKLNLFVIEDCAQAHGAIYKGRSVGSIGHIGAWSFCQDKIMTTGGEGGMVTTNDSGFWEKMWSYKDHGKSWHAVYEKKHPPGFRWLHDSFGTNWRMTEMQAAIGLIQLKLLPDWNRARRENLKMIWKAAQECKNLRVPQLNCQNCNQNCEQGFGCIHAAYKCYVFVKGDEKFRDKFKQAVHEEGVPCMAGSCSEVYLEHAFDNTEYRPKERLLVAKELGETSLMFLCHPTLTKENLTQTYDALRKADRLM